MDDIAINNKLKIEKYINKRRILGLIVDDFEICEDTSSEHYGKICLIRINSNDTKYVVPDFVQVVGRITHIKNQFVAYVLKDNKYVREITICENVDTIEKCAFRDCRIVKVKIEGNIKEIGESAFKYCTDLTEFEFSKCKESKIGKEAFRDCYNLKNADLRGVIEIDNGAFYHCKSIKNVSLSEKLKVIERNVFSYCSLKEIIVPDSVEKIEYCALVNYNSLKYIKLGSGIDFISNSFLDINFDLNYNKEVDGNEKIAIDITSCIDKICSNNLRTINNSSIILKCTEEYRNKIYKNIMDEYSSDGVLCSFELV